MTIQSWREVNGDHTLALDWNLTPGSVVWEIGGYEGRWVEQMADKFDCFIEVFEPQTWAVAKMVERFNYNPKISIHPYGLWIENTWKRMGDYFTDGASILKPVDSDHLSEFRDIYEELDGDDHVMGKNMVQVCLMNIEGAEYSLIRYLLEMDIMPVFKNFWCQFHEFADPDGSMKEFIYSGLARTHDILWDHFPTAVAWRQR